MRMCIPELLQGSPKYQLPDFFVEQHLLLWLFTFLGLFWNPPGEAQGLQYYLAQVICRKCAPCPCVWWEISWCLEEKCSHWHIRRTGEPGFAEVSLARASGPLAQPHLCLFLRLAQPKQVSCCCVVLHLQASSPCEQGALQAPCNPWEGGLHGGEHHLLGQASPITSEGWIQCAFASPCRGYHFALIHAPALHVLVASAGSFWALATSYGPCCFLILTCKRDVVLIFSEYPACLWCLCFPFGSRSIASGKMPSPCRVCKSCTEINHIGLLPELGTLLYAEITWSRNKKLVKTAC